MGEWAVAPEARSVPPGPITLVISNRGKLAHGFEIKAESGSGRDGSGRLELQSGVVAPGRTVRMRITLPAGAYEIECFVADHDDRGMQGLMQVRPGAPQPGQSRAAGSATGVRIDGFAFAPRTISVKAGQSVTWRNADAAEHTVTQAPGGFSSKSMGRGDGYTRRFAKTGRYSYLCALHPGMKGVVDVKP
jgi:plastocyanin